MFLTCFVPGWLLITILRLDVDSLLEGVALAVGLSYGLTTLASIALLYLLGRLPPAAIVGTLVGISLALTAVRWRRAAALCEQGFRIAISDLCFFGACIILAAFFVVFNLSYADYWGDEMNGLLRAVALIGGRSETIFEHTKGPVEIIVPAVLAQLVSRFDPFTVRLPSTLAHVAGIAAFYLLIRRMFGRNVALLAAAFLSLNGLYIAFGRMVQYQAVVFLTGTLAILAAYRFYKGGRAANVTVAGLLAGTGMLAHYETLLMLPAIAYLVWSRLSWRFRLPKAEFLHMGFASIIFLSVLAFFYLPLVLHPSKNDTIPYLTQRIGGTIWPVNNLDALYRFSLLYNSGYYIGLVTILGGSKLLQDLQNSVRQAVRKRAHWLLLASAALVALGVVVGGRSDLLLMIFSFAILGALIGFTTAGAETRTLYIWFTVSYIGYVFLVSQPRTHLRVIYPPWLVLSALAVLEGVRLTLHPCVDTSNQPVASGGGSTRGIIWLQSVGKCFLNWLKPCLLIFTLALLPLFGWYQYLLFLDIQAEYVFTYPAHKNEIFWEDPAFPFGSRRPYGMPHRLGWQMIQQRFLDGTLQGDWDSNDDGTNLFWYTLGWPRNPCYPRYYFATQFEQKEREHGVAQPSFKLDYYAHIGQIRNRDRLQIDVYEFAPLRKQTRPAIWSEPENYTSFVTPADFHTLPYTEPALTISTPLASPAVFRPAPEALQRIADYYGDARVLGVHDKVALLGYDLDTQWARPGGVLLLTLYWQAMDVVNLPYKVFVHLDDEVTARTLAQADDFPACGTRPTQTWRTDQIVADRHIIELPADLPAGSYPLRVGLYEPQTQQRMDLLDVANNPQGTFLTVATVDLENTS